MQSTPTWKENIGFGSLLTGLLTLALGVTWLINTFFEVGSPALMERRTTYFTIIAGLFLICLGLLITWPRSKKR